MRRKGEKEFEPYVKLANSMTESAAWTALSFGAVWVYIELRKSFNFNKGGNDHLILPYSKVKWKMNSATFNKKIKELLHYGLIKKTGVWGGLLRTPCVYALSNRWEKTSREIVDKEGREARKAFKKNHPQELPTALREYILRKKHQDKKQDET